MARSADNARRSPKQGDACVRQHDVLIVSHDLSNNRVRYYMTSACFTQKEMYLDEWVKLSGTFVPDYVAQRGQEDNQSKVNAMPAKPKTSEKTVDANRTARDAQLDPRPGDACDMRDCPASTCFLLVKVVTPTSIICRCDDGDCPCQGINVEMTRKQWRELDGEFIVDADNQEADNAVITQEDKPRVTVKTEIPNPTMESTMATAAPVPTTAPTTTLLELATQGAKQGAAFSALHAALTAGLRARGMTIDDNLMNVLTAVAAMTIHAAGSYGERPKLVAFGELALVGAASHGITDIFSMLEDMITPLINDVERGKGVFPGTGM